MDFKGHMPLINGADCHPLTMIDDHSRYVVCLKACADERRLTVQDHLTATFRRYDLPDAFYTDNGSPWGNSSGVHWTGLKVWLLKLGIRVLHARPHHPQARGKNERFHRTLKDEVFALRRFRNLPEVQRAFDVWRSRNGRPCQPLSAKFPRHAQSASKGRVRQWRDRPHRLIDPALHPLQGPDVDRPAGLCRRASCHQAPESRWALRNLFRQLAGRINRLDGRPKCQ
jgi:transposase InsO family protein